MDLKKIQKYLWGACFVFSLICLGAAIWLCTTTEADMITYAMTGIFCMAMFWSLRNFRAN